MKVDVKRRDSGTGQIVYVTYDRQDKLNALNSDGIDALSSSFESLSNDPDVRAVILTGAGSKAFIGGADITELSNLNPQTAKVFISSLHDLFVKVREFPVPVVAQIEGYALGAGMELAAACDLRIGSENAIFGMPEVRVGVPSVIEAALLPRLVGWGRSNYLVFTGENIDGKTAYLWGFLEQIVSPNRLADETNRAADAIASSGPIAIRSQKHLTRQWEILPLEHGIQAGIDSFASAYETDEPKTMMQPFLERKNTKDA
jgi:enoyl-CoA hydratase